MMTFEEWKQAHIDGNQLEIMYAHAERIAWLEAEVGRLAGKVDATVSLGDERDTPTPKPTD